MTEQVFKTHLNSVLKDNAIGRYVSNKKKGSLNTKRLYKISQSDKIFKQKEERKGKDYSITMLLDISDSMSYVYHTEYEMTDKLVSIFEKLNIPTSIYTFGESVRKVKKFEEKYIKDDFYKLFRKSIDLEFIWCRECYSKDFDESLKYCPFCKNTSVLKNYENSCGTNDAYALHIVGNEICKAYKKNILIVITDGQGEDYFDEDKLYVGSTKMDDLRNAETVLSKLHKKYEDLIVVAVDLNSGHCKSVYGVRNSYYIKESKEIFKAVTTLLQRNIKRV